jgi:hypothetical protein
MSQSWNTTLKLVISFLACGAVPVRIQPANREPFLRFDLSREPTVIHQTELSMLRTMTVSTNATHAVFRSGQQTLVLQFVPFLIVVFLA